MDRNPGAHLVRNAQNGSLSARRAWIEIATPVVTSTAGVVALRKESVDRNAERLCNALKHLVALRKESVDRNVGDAKSVSIIAKSLSARRAWIEITSCWRVSGRTLSLSARRAWIEITAQTAKNTSIASLSARRAWIEIEITLQTVLLVSVSLSARRAWIEIEAPSSAPYAELSRSPQGERG